MVNVPAVGGDRTPRDAVVPVLLAVFVIVVASFLVTVVLDMGQETRGVDPAGASVEFDAPADAIRVTFTSSARPGTTLTVTVRNASTDRTVANWTLTNVGAARTFRVLEEGEYRVVVVAAWAEHREVVAIRTGRV